MNFTYDAAARLNDVNSSLSGGTYHYYTPTWFYPSGQAGYANFGNGLLEVDLFDNRLRLAADALDTANSALRFHNYNYFANGTCSRSSIT